MIEAALEQLQEPRRALLGILSPIFIAPLALLVNVVACCPAFLIIEAALKEADPNWAEGLGLAYALFIVPGTVLAGLVGTAFATVIGLLVPRAFPWISIAIGILCGVLTWVLAVPLFIGFA